MGNRYCDKVSELLFTLLNLQFYTQRIMSRCVPLLNEPSHIELECAALKLCPVIGYQNFIYRLNKPDCFNRYSRTTIFVWTMENYH